MAVRSPCGTSTASLGLAQRAELALAYAGGTLELPQLLLAAAKLIPSPFCTWRHPS